MLPAVAGGPGLCTRCVTHERTAHRGTATGLTGSLALDSVWYGAGGAPSCSAPRPPLRPARVRPFCREGARLWCARAHVPRPACQCRVENERTNERTRRRKRTHRVCRCLAGSGSSGNGQTPRRRASERCTEGRRMEGSLRRFGPSHDTPSVGVAWWRQATSTSRHTARGRCLAEYVEERTERLPG